MIAQWYWSHMLSLKYLQWLEIATSIDHSRVKAMTMLDILAKLDHKSPLSLPGKSDRKSVGLSIASLPNWLAVFH